MFKRPENWTPEKEKEENYLNILIEIDLAEEDNDVEILQYNVFAKAGLV